LPRTCEVNDAQAAKAQGDSGFTALPIAVKITVCMSIIRPAMAQRICHPLEGWQLNCRSRLAPYGSGNSTHKIASIQAAQSQPVYQHLLFPDSLTNSAERYSRPSGK
jgi:hypothetical protein